MKKQMLFDLMTATILLAATLLGGCGRQAGSSALPGSGAVPPAPRPAERTIRYDLEAPGPVSLAVYERETGVLLRTLLSGQKQAAGQHAVEWDGLDRLGQPVEPGTYEWKLLRTPGLTAEYLLTLGTNPGTKLYDTWPGNHNGIHGVAVDGDRLYLGSSGSEVSPALIVTSLDGKERLGGVKGFEAWKGVVRLVSRGEFYYVLQQDGKMHMRRTDGEWVGHHSRKDLAWPDAAADEKAKAAAGNAMDIAVAVADGARQLVVGYRDRNAIRWVDPETLDPHRQGEVGFLDTAEVESPAGVAIDGEGRVLATSGSRLVRLSRQDKTPVVLAEGLVAPGRLDVCPGTGDILVVEGAPSHRIKRFAADGTLLNIYGREGGRRQGLYVATDFLGVSDIAADGQGGFVICEMGTAPRRVTHFDRHGEIVNEWYGGQQFFQHVHPDPADPTRVWISSQWGWVMQVIVDYERRTWRVHSTYRIQGMANDLIPGHLSSTGWKLVRRDGIAYLLQNGRPYFLKVDEVNHQLIPVMASGMQITHYWSAQPQFIKDLLDNDSKSKKRSYVWVDQNGDGLPQAGEVQFSEWAVWWSGWSLDDQFNLYGTDGTKVYTLPLAGWNEHGAPIYDSWGEPQVRVTAPTGVKSLAGYSADAGAFLPDADGGLFGIFNDQSESHGWGWTGDMFVNTGVVKWSADGQPLWVVGRHANSRPNPPGQTHNPVKIIGRVHDCVVVAERVVQPAVLWDGDGLYVGTFFDYRADDGRPEALYNWWRPVGADHTEDGYINYDCLAGGAIHELDNGDVLWFAPGWNNTMVYRVTGWNGWTRQHGQVSVATLPDHAKAAGTGLAASYFASPDLSGAPALERLDERVAFDWKAGSPVPGKLDPGGFSVRWEGQVEAPFSEDFVFSAYGMDGVRLWLDGQLLIDRWTAWDGREKHFNYTKNLRFTKTESRPVALAAGHRYPLRLEYYKGEASPEARMFLNWESPTLERRHIPTRHLYPGQEPANE